MRTSQSTVKHMGCGGDGVSSMTNDNHNHVLFGPSMEGERMQRDVNGEHREKEWLHLSPSAYCVMYGSVSISAIARGDGACQKLSVT